MGRPIGTKNTMRTPEEKEKLVKEFLEGGQARSAIAKENNISRRLFSKWVEKYQKFGIKGLNSKTGKQPNSNPNFGKYNRYPTEEEKLKREITKLEIEVARLKKGYQVKGVGAQKDYVTTFDANMK